MLPTVAISPSTPLNLLKTASFARLLSMAGDEDTWPTDITPLPKSTDQAVTPLASASDSSNGSSRPSFHSALAVSNIKNLIPIILDVSNTKYNSWAELFKVAARAHRVLDHIDPAVARPADIDDALWDQLDAIILQWIYATISSNLLLTILEPNSTALLAWTRLKNIFQDNKASRVVYLQNEFARCRLESFSSIFAYCQHLKDLADQLANVDSKISDRQLVIQLIVSLTA